MLRMVGVGALAICLWFSSCGSKERQTNQRGRTVSADELLAFNAQKASQQAALLDSLAPDSLGFHTDGGLRVKWSGPQRSENQPPHPDGTVVSWSGQIRLANGEPRYTFSAENPLRIAIGFSDWPEAFHEIASKCQTGDSIDCWIPAARAWGLTGNPPEIPQDAVIHLEVVVCAVQHAVSA